MKSKLFVMMGLVLSALSAGCVMGEVSDSQICVTQAQLTFPGAPVPGISATVSKSFDLDISQQLSNLAVGGASTDGSQVNMLDVKLVADSGVTDFGFIQQLVLSLDSEVDTTLGAKQLINYSSSASSVPSPLDMPADSTINLFPYLSKGAAKVTVDVTGTIPAGDWTVDVVVCVAVDMKLTKSL